MSTAQMNAFNSSSMRMQYLPEDDPYPNIREYLAPEYARLTPEDVEALLEREGIRAEAMEGFFDDVGKAFSGAAKAVAPVVTKALPGVISGAAAGCALGPWGCLGGALIGGVGSALSSGGGKSAGGSSPGSAIAGAIPAIAGAAGGGGGVASGIASALPAIAGLVGGAGGAGGGGKTNPAGILLGLFQRPEVQQALMSMALGSAGRKDVSVGGNSVPASAVAGLVGTLGSKAFTKAEAMAEPSEDLPGYLYNNGVLAVDPAVPSERAARLLEMFGEVAVREPRIPAFTGADEYYDALDMAELDFIETEGNDLEFDD
jgi:hypothetical protein